MLHLNWTFFHLVAKSPELCLSINAERKMEMSNYRPISILTCFCKIIEKLIYHRFINFFEKHSVFTKSQYGFRNNSSTTHAALDIVINAFDQINNHYSCPVFLDYKKFFDTVCHNILLQKLDQYRIRGVASY